MKRFSLGTELIFGEGSLDFLSTLGKKSAMVVTDSFFSRSGLAKTALDKVGSGIIFDKVQPDPSALLAAEGAALLKQHKPDLLIALGGGSAMDCAKGILLAAESRPTFVAIPTTSGTGSEVTSFSILTHDDVKHALIDPTMRPDYAILDADLLHDLPPKLIAESGMDALCHCVEAAAAKNANAITDALAGEALRLLLEYLPRSFSGDTAARSHVHLAAAMAGIAFDNAGLGAVHALAHALGGAYHLPHGRLCGILLPIVMEENKTAAGAKYAALAAGCGMASFSQLRRSILCLRKSLLLPATLKEAGFAAIDANAIVSAAMKDPCLAGNPKTAAQEDLLRILKEAMG